MEYTISDQLYSFLFSIVCGLILGVLYEVLRLVRICFFNGKVALFIFDVLFMVISAFVTVLFSICYTKGFTRYSTLIGEFLAVVFVRFTLGRISVRIFEPLCLKTREKVLKIAVNMGKVIKKLLQETMNILYNNHRKIWFFHKKDSISE